MARACQQSDRCQITDTKICAFIRRCTSEPIRPLSSYCKTLAATTAIFLGLTSTAMTLPSPLKRGIADCTVEAFSRPAAASFGSSIQSIGGMYFSECLRKASESGRSGEQSDPARIRSDED